MANFNVIPFYILGRQVSFKNLANERQLLELDLPPDFPEHFKQSIVSGVVQNIILIFNPKMEMDCEIVIDDNTYCLSDVDWQTFTVD